MLTNLESYSDNNRKHKDSVNLDFKVYLFIPADSMFNLDPFTS